jgi:PAS domain S-box-containing protein
MRILLVEDNSGDVRLLREYLKDAGADRYQITHADRLASGLERLAEANVDAVLLDLSLPDSHGMATLVRMREAAKAVPIVVLTGIEDEALGMRLIQAGAQDYLIKGQVTGPLLTRSLRYAVERKRAEAALRDSEERFRHLFEGARDVIITLSEEGVVTSLNPAFEHITQWASDEWIGQPIAPLFHADDLPLAIDLFRHIVGQGETRTCVLRIRSRDRGYVVEEFVGVPHVQNGQTSGLLMIGRDITERKRVEDTLERLRHLYGLLLTSAPDGIYGIDLQGKAIFVNPAAARMLGSSSEELLGRHMHDVVHHTKPDGTVYSSEECPIYQALCGGVIHYVADDVFWRTDGTSFPVEYTSTPIVERSGIVGAVVMFRDITERKRVEAALRESEARHRAILDNSPGMVFLKDNEGRYLDVNCQFERIFHVNREEIAGKTDDEIFPSEQAAAFRANDLKVLQAGAPMQFEEVALHDDGPHTSVVYKFPLNNGDGKPYGICGITADITVRKAMEEALRQAEEKYRSIFENAVEGIFQSTPGGRYLSVNPALARMYGYDSPEELMGSVTDIAHQLYVDPDQRKEMIRIFELRGVLQGFEYEVYRKDGSRIWISESARVVRDEGCQVLYYEGTIEDITERRQVDEERERLATMIESSNDAIVSLTEGRVSFWNPAAEKLFGYSSEEILGQHVNILVPPHLRSEMARNVESVLRGEQTREFETERVRKDRSLVSVSITLSPLKDVRGNVVGPFAIIRDITERKRVEEALRRTQFAMDQAVDAIYWIDAEAKIVYANASASAMLGYSPDELRTMTVPDLNPDFPSDMWPEYWADTRTRKTLTLDTFHRAKDGRLIPVEIQVSFLAYGGQEFHCAFVRDVTERKRAEEELRKNLEYLELAQTGAAAGLWDWEIGSNKITWSKQYYHLYGLSPATTPSYENWLASVYEEDRQRVDLAVREAVMHCSDINLDYRIIHPERGLRWIAAIGRTICDDNGVAVRATGCSFDITQRKRAAEELQRTLDELRTLSRRLEVVREDERTRIARELHDELGVRMACLKMDLARMQSMKSDVSPAKLEEKIVSMTEQVDATIAAVQELVAELRPGVLDDLGLVPAIEWQCRDFERRSGIRCLVDCKQEDIPLDSVKATAAFRICQEALTNVSRHAAAKEIRVRLELIDRQLLLDVQDDGQGIPPEKVCDIRSFGLLGMRERAEAVGGTLRIAGLPGLGTTVSLRLPCD